MTPQLAQLLSELTLDNVTEKTQILIDEIGITNYTNSLQTELMFAYNNLLFPQAQEHGKSCGTCRGRVYNRLVNHLKTNIE